MTGRLACGSGSGREHVDGVYVALSAGQETTLRPAREKLRQLFEAQQRLLDAQRLQSFPGEDRDKEGARRLIAGQHDLDRMHRISCTLLTNSPDQQLQALEGRCTIAVSFLPVYIYSEQRRLYA